MSYNISVDEQNRVINVVWNGALEFSVLKRYVLSYSYHMTHTDHHVLYDFRNVSDIVLNKDDLSQIADLAGQVLDPLLKDIKVGMITSASEITELAKLFVSIREERSDGPPMYGFFDDHDQAMSWLVNDGQ